MGLISRLFGRSEEPLDQHAGMLVQAARIHATSSYVPLLDRFPILGTVQLEQWDFFVTIAGVFIAASCLNNLRLPEARENYLIEQYARDLDEWNHDGIRAFEDCKAFFDREYDRLTALGHDTQFVASDALGLWIVSNVLGRRPTTDEELGLVRGIGALTTHAFFNWWSG